MTPLRERLLFSLVPPLGYAYIRLLRATQRTEFVGREHLETARRDHGRYILAIWHSRFLLAPFVHPGGRLTALASRHRDARLLGKILIWLGLDVTWGSSTAGGATALREIVRKVGEGYDVFITPDGPRGPRRRAKAGVVAAGRLTGLPILPTAVSASPARRLASWDRTLVPWPLGRAVYAVGEPILVPRDADADLQERRRLEIEAALDRVTDEADRLAGLPVEAPRPGFTTP